MEREVPTSPRGRKSAKRRTKPLIERKGDAPPRAPDSWRLGTVERLSPAILVCEPLGAMRRRALARLSYDVAWDLVRTVVEATESAPLIGSAAPNLRTLKPSGHLSVEESERLLHVGRLYVILESEYGASLARGMLATPLPGLDQRSVIEQSDSVAAIEYARGRLVPFVQLQFEGDLDDAST